MRAIFGIALLALVGAGAISCKEKITSPPVAQLAGTWTATQAEYVSKTSPGRYDVIGHGGSATLVLLAERRYQYVELRTGMMPDTVRGAWSMNEDEMTWTCDGTNWTRSYNVVLSGNTLRLTGGDVLYDFGAGGLEESDHNLVLTRS